jgi:hypothetical protein
MKKLFIIAAIALLGGMMTACSSSEDEFDVEQVEPALRPLLGYWQYTGPTYDSQVGYIFKSSGEVVRWSIDHSADGSEYKERHFGTYGIDDEQHYYLKGDSKENMTEGAYYYITEFTPDSMTIYCPGSTEIIDYRKYKKLSSRP